jgi:MoaA/NifB/PqqE/SkfB family radical SAM enzyme
MGQVYSGMKIFHFKDKVDSLPPEETIRPPLHVRIKPTNVCAHDCWYCAYRVDNLQLGEAMDKRDFIRRPKMMEICEDLAEMGVKAVTFSGGGDPFYYPYLPETLERLIQAQIKFASLTNGARLDGRLAELFSAHATWLRISIDGWDGPSYARYRGVDEQEYARVMANIAAFQRMGGPCFLGVNLIVDKDNASHVHDKARRLRDMGVNSLKVSPCIVSNDGAQTSAYHRPFAATVRDQLEQIRADLVSTEFQLFDDYHDMPSDFSKPYDWCPYLQILPVIGADLNLYSCQDKAYNPKGAIGSLKHQRLRDLWFADKAAFMRINPRHDCNHHCVADRKNRMLFDYLGADEGHLEFV